MRARRALSHSSVLEPSFVFRSTAAWRCDDTRKAEVDLPRFVYIILTTLKCPDRTVRTLQARPSKPVLLG